MKNQAIFSYQLNRFFKVNSLIDRDDDYLNLIKVIFSNI